MPPPEGRSRTRSLHLLRGLYHELRIDILRLPNRIQRRARNKLKKMVLISVISLRYERNNPSIPSEISLSGSLTWKSSKIKSTLIT